MNALPTHSGHRKLALAIALAMPGLALAQVATPVPQALASFSAKARGQNHLTAADVASPIVTSSYFDTSTGLTHTYLQQQVNGLTVFNANGAVHTDANGKVVFFNQDFVADAAAIAPAATPGLTPEQAVGAAAKGLGLPTPVAMQRLVEGRAAQGIIFNKGGISEKNIPVRLMYLRVDNRLVLVWNVTIAQLDQQHHWSARVDAQTGRMLDRNDYVVSELSTFRQHVIAAQRKLIPSAALAATVPTAARAVMSAKGTAGVANSLTVIPVPFESPDLSPRVAIPFSSASPLYSPYGWQVGDSRAPSNFFADSYSFLTTGKQLTRGNNVAAYDDNANNNGSAAAATSSPNGGTTRDFDFPFDQKLGPRDPGNLAASITNLFYWNNMLHDVMMSKGFDEASGNFQYKNIGAVGAGGDFVRAEAQDGSGRNNANFSTPADGDNGRMQMYLFDNRGPNTLTITGTSSAAGTYKFAAVSFGPSLTEKPLKGQLVLVNDGVSADGGAHGCASPYVNKAAVAGNIAFIQRGGCPQLTGLNPRANNRFEPKVLRAQENGATAVIVFDSLGTNTDLTNFGGTNKLGVTIPAIFISGADGFKLRAAMLTGATLSAAAALGTLGPDLDGSFDNGVVSHEFGHGISTRLTGGPANSGCLDNTTGNQTMGEGWSDFFGLWMTTRPGDIGSKNRYVATYDSGQPTATGPGFRGKPYTTNFAQNDYTYAKLGNTAGKFQETHDVGEVWATVLWDLNWQFVYRYGYNADFFAATGGNNKALKLVLDGCKLQVCSPGFLDGRDALLRADTLTNRAANAGLIWNVFARRGMGYSAVQGNRVNGAPLVTGIVEAFDLPRGTPAIALATMNGAIVGSALEAFPNPAQDMLTVRTQLPSTVPMQVTMLDLLGKTVLRTIAVPTVQMQRSGIELNTNQLAPGIYIVRVTTSDGTYSTRVSVQR